MYHEYYQIAPYIDLKPIYIRIIDGYLNAFIQGLSDIQR